MFPVCSIEGYGPAQTRFGERLFPAGLQSPYPMPGMRAGDRCERGSVIDRALAAAGVAPD